MKFSIRFADQIVGTLVLLALAILVFVIFMLGKSQRWFVKDCEYKAYFTSASGISPNMAVQYKGFTIGHVKKLSLADDDRVEVIFSIFEEYTDRVTKSSLVERVESPIGLGSSFNFYPGVKGETPLDELSEIPVVDSQKSKELISEGRKSGDNISNIMDQVSSILDNIDKAIVGADGKPSLEKIISNVEAGTASLQTLAENISGQLQPILANLEDVSKKISDPDGGVMKLLGGEGPLYETINSLSGIIDNLKTASELIPAELPQIAVAINRLNVVLKQVEDVLKSVANNPLLKGGIPEDKEAGPAGASPRNQDFNRRGN